MKTNIVLYKPEIPQNTGNIIRTCVATNSALHLIKPYGFDLNLSERVFKRNSTNYVEEVELYEYESFEEFMEKNSPKEFYFLTRYGKNTYSDIKVDKNKDYYFIFGSESSGIDPQIIKAYPEATFRIPMDKKMRSLNLSNCVALVTYHAISQVDFEGLTLEEPHKVNYWE